MEDNLKEKRSCLAKADAKMVVAIIVLALAVVLFVCSVISIADSLKALSEAYRERLQGLSGSAYTEVYEQYKEALKSIQIACTTAIMKHIANIAIASLIVGVFAKKRSEIASEIKSRNVIKLEANTIPCPKCGAEIDRDETSSSLVCPECGAKYRNPFYKG